jgi:FkbM family methyltransferase
MSAVGPTNGILFFDGSDPLGGHVSAIAPTPNSEPFPVNTLDRLLEENPLPPPYMIKLDVHGVEIPILSAGLESLRSKRVAKVHFKSALEQ